MSLLGGMVAGSIAANADLVEAANHRLKKTINAYASDIESWAANAKRWEAYAKRLEGQLNEIMGDNQMLRGRIAHMDAELQQAKLAVAIDSAIIAGRNAQTKMLAAEIRACPSFPDAHPIIVKDEHGRQPAQDIYNAAFDAELQAQDPTINPQDYRPR